MSDSRRSPVSQQYAFTLDEGNSEEAIAPSEESVKPSLETFGATVDHRKRNSRLDRPAATEFGIDDRPAVSRSDSGEQGALFADTTEDQRTLTGEHAAEQCLFETSDTNPANHDEDEAERDNPDRTVTKAVTDGGQDSRDTFDPAAETVTEAWKGAFIYTSWGYGQTNVELAQIVEVSDSGKTVRARLVTADRVDTARGTESLRPSTGQYGESFRLHVRDSGGDPAFRGRYPYISGEKDDGERLNSFLPFENTPENTVHQTPPNCGH